MFTTNIKSQPLLLITLGQNSVEGYKNKILEKKADIAMVRKANNVI